MLEVGGVAYDPLALDAAERAFWGDLWRAAPAALAAEHGIELHAAGAMQATLVRALPQAPMLNLVLGAAEDPTRLPATLDWAQARGVDFYVPLTPGLPGTEPAERELIARGYERGYTWMKFVRAAAASEQPDPPGIDVVELTEGGGAPLGAIVATGFGLPAWMGALFEGVAGHDGWHCYLAHVDGEPAGAATMRVLDGVAEFGAAATLPVARGRGCQTALLHRRIRDATSAGCHVLAVETGERTEDRPSASYRNIMRAGFREAYLRPNWRWVTPAPPPPGPGATS